LSPRTLVSVAGLAALLIAVGIVALMSYRGWDSSAEAGVSRLRLDDIPFNGARAYQYLQQLCALGPRRSGSPAMLAQQRLLAEHFSRLGAQIEWQRFEYRHPQDGSPVTLANLVVHWHPQSKDRVLLCTHYDTLPFPLRDPRNPQGRFVGANDGGSGAALLMELGHEIPRLTAGYGVDFAFFDAEEFIFHEQGRYFVGSEHFARQYVSANPPYRYRWGILLDMVGDADLELYQERLSVSWPDTRPLVDDVWATARRLGVREFIFQQKYAVRDDHVPLHDLAGIPTCDLIDFDYPAWHTEGDTVERCSALSLAKVGWVVWEWLKSTAGR
jgi:glutaminyl-peptide cyclotransferase